MGLLLPANGHKTPVYRRTAARSELLISREPKIPGISVGHRTAKYLFQ